MKFIRFIFGATICLFALYGGYELYVQNLAKDKFSDEVLQDLRDSGFDVGSGNSKDAVSAMLQSDLGPPSASFGMRATDLPSPSGSSSAISSTGMSGSASPTSGLGGLPPSLRSSTGATAVVSPESQQYQYQSATSQTTSPTQPLSSPAEQQNQVQINTPDFGSPTIPSPQSFQPTFEFPVFMNPGDSPEVMSPPTFEHSDEANSAGKAALETPDPNNGPVMEHAAQLPIQPPPPQPIPNPMPPAPVVEPIQETQPLPWPSAYTFNVAMPPAEEIKTTESTQEQPQVYLPPIQPGEQQPANPCTPELAAYQPQIATTNAQVQPLPPVWDDLPATSVNPPTFHPNPNVMALPPIEEEIPTTETAVPMMATVTPTVQHLTQTTPQPIEQPPQQIEAMAQPLVTMPVQTFQQDQQPTTQNIAAQTQSPPSAVQPAIMPQPQNHPQPIMQANGVTPLPLSQDSEIDPAVATKVAKIGELLAQDQVTDAYQQLSRMYFYDEMTTDERQYVAKRLDQLAGGVLFSRRHHILEPPYLVKEGDTVESIATQYKITPELLRKLNAVPGGENVAVGTQLKVLRGPLDAKIYPGYHEMVILMRGNYACRFPISVGSGYAGQEGGFTVQEKDMNRGYQLAPGMEVIPPGDPANPLGSRWIELSKELGTIGIHGTNNPGQIGTTRQSAGYFGLREQDIAEVYDMLTIGSNVTIVR